MPAPLFAFECPNTNIVKVLTHSKTPWNNNCGMYIPLSDVKHWFVRNSSKKAHWKSEKKFSDNFFSNKNIFLKLNFVLDWILPRTEFCLGFCLGLHTAVVFRMQSFNLLSNETLNMCFSDTNCYWNIVFNTDNHNTPTKGKSNCR